MTDEWKALLDEARGRRKDGLLRRWAHYECLKDKLRERGLPPEEYQSAAQEIAALLGV